MEIRTLTHADIDAAADLTARVFGTPEQYASYFALSRAANLYCPFTPPELCYGVFEGSRLLAKCQLVDLSMRVLGIPVRTVGSLAIAAEPAERGTDAVRRVVEAAHASVRDAGFDLVVGVAQRGSLYHRLGGRPICAEPVWELDAERVPPPRSTTLRKATEQDLPWVLDTYNLANAARSATLVRSQALYAFLPRRAQELWVAADGYVAVRMHADALEVREVAGLGGDFFDGALRELALHARTAGVRRIWGHVPHDHEWVLASVPYGARVSLEYPRASGCMAGVVDAQRLVECLVPSLEQRLAHSRFADACVRLTLHIDDTTCCCTLGAHGSRMLHLERRLSAGAFLQMAMGYLPPSSLLAAERALLGPGMHAPFVPDVDEEALLGALFAQPAPFMWHTDRF